MISSPSLLRLFARVNQGKPYADQINPPTFLLLPLSARSSILLELIRSTFIWLLHGRLRRLNGLSSSGLTGNPVSLFASGHGAITATMVWHG